MEIFGPTPYERVVSSWLITYKLIHVSRAHTIGVRIHYPVMVNISCADVAKRHKTPTSPSFFPGFAFYYALRSDTVT